MINIEPTIRRLNAQQRIVMKNRDSKEYNDFMREKIKILPDMFALAKRLRRAKIRYDITGKNRIYFILTDKLSIMYPVDEMLMFISKEDLDEYLENANVEYV